MRGRGEAHSFTTLGWVKEQFRSKMGFTPFPGTLNLEVKEVETLKAWRAEKGIAIEPSPGYCAAKCFPVRVNGKLRAGWIVPQVPGYPENIVELMAPVSLREALGLKDGDAVFIQSEEPRT